MQKDFDSWNKNKKRIHGDSESKLYHERELWWCSLGVNIGFEQDGTGRDNQRPVLIVRGFSKNICLVVPLTTSAKKNPYHVGLDEVDGREAFAVISQIRLIDTKRLVNKIGFLDQELFQKTKKAVKDLL